MTLLGSEVAVARGGRPDADRAVGQPHPGAVAIGRRVDRDGLDAELVAGADHAHGDLAPVRDEHSLHRGASSNSGWPNSTGCALSTSTLRTVPA